MLRTTSGGRTAALPYLYKWTSASLDLTNVTALAAPVQLDGLQGVSYLQLSLAGDTNTPKTFTWQLTLYDVQNAAVVRSIAFSTTSTSRRQVPANSSGAFLHGDVMLDIGGMGENLDRQTHWVLALADIDTDSGAYLTGYAPSRLEGSVS